MREAPTTHRPRKDKGKKKTKETNPPTAAFRLQPPPPIPSRTAGETQQTLSAVILGTGILSPPIAIGGFTRSCLVHVRGGEVMPAYRRCAGMHVSYCSIQDPRSQGSAIQGIDNSPLAARPSARQFRTGAFNRHRDLPPSE